ncbi:MAG: type II toxin-antitoxin system PemK/MazF family toxin [Firmicutes bacterium]|nr:type II toxin-antitoxin system PemK/MazF family toxin [Bacillota bacterium]
MALRRGEIFFAELNPVQGSEQGGVRPVLVVQNDVGNNFSPTTIVLPITSRMCKAKLPTHVELSRKESGLARDSVVLAEQIRTIDKQRLQQRVAVLDELTMSRINQAMEISMGIVPTGFAD